MSVCDYLALDQKVDIEILEGGKKINLAAVVKDVEDSSIVVKTSDILKHFNEIVRGAEAQISGGNGNLDFKIPATVTEGNKFPLIKLTPMGETVFTQKRNFVRVEDCLSCKYIILDKDDYKEVQKEHLNKTPDKCGTQAYLSETWHHERENTNKDSEIGAAIVQLLINIDRKLNVILDSVDTSGKNVMREKKATIENISGAGAKISCEEELAVGDILRIELILPTFPISPIIVFGEAVRVEESDVSRKKDFGVVVKFTTIREDDRDTLVRYVFQKQRELLRSSKKTLR